MSVVCASHSVYVRVQEVEGADARESLQDQVRNFASDILVKSREHVDIVLRVSATIVHFFHDQYLDRVASECGSFDIASFCLFAPALINNPRFLVPLITSLLAETGWVGPTLIQRHAARVLFDHPIVTTIANCRVDPDEKGKVHVYYLAKLQQLEGTSMVWTRRSDLIVDAHNREAVKEYEKQISIRFRPAATKAGRQIRVVRADS